MMGERKADLTQRVEVDGYELVTYSFGSGDEVLFCLNGGPGMACDYIRDSHSWLADKGYRVVCYDQLGCGDSDKPDDPGLWTLERYVREAEAVRAALNLGVVHLYGHSWGTWFGIEYALTYPDCFKSFVIANGSADIAHSSSEQIRLRRVLGLETDAMMERYEARGLFDHPEYVAAVTLLNYRYVCNLEIWPDAVNRSIAACNPAPFEALQGPNEFCYTGTMKDWNRIPELRKITQPVLIMTGRYDAGVGKRMLDALPNAQARTFNNGTHLIMWEVPEMYFEALLEFLDSHRG
jgi:proline iminopeptidase